MGNQLGQASFETCLPEGQVGIQVFVEPCCYEPAKGGKFNLTVFLRFYTFRKTDKIVSMRIIYNDKDSCEQNNLHRVGEHK